MLVLTFVPLAQQIVLVMSHALYVVALDVMYIRMIKPWASRRQAKKPRTGQHSVYNNRTICVSFAEYDDHALRSVLKT